VFNPRARTSDTSRPVSSSNAISRSNLSPFLSSSLLLGLSGCKYLSYLQDRPLCTGSDWCAQVRAVAQSEVHSLSIRTRSLDTGCALNRSALTRCALAALLSNQYHGSAWRALLLQRLGARKNVANVRHFVVLLPPLKGLCFQDGAMQHVMIRDPDAQSQRTLQRLRAAPLFTVSSSTMLCKIFNGSRDEKLQREQGSCSPIPRRMLAVPARLYKIM
jgi:hypothetical protein